MQQLEEQIKQWADGSMPNRTLASRLRKLGEEFGELAEAVVQRTDVSENAPNRINHAAASNVAREAADCAIVLSDICSMLGYSLSGVMTGKFAEVQARPSAGDFKPEQVYSSTEAYYASRRDK